MCACVKARGDSERVVVADAAAVVVVVVAVGAIRCGGGGGGGGVRRAELGYAGLAGRGSGRWAESRRPRPTNGASPARWGKFGERAFAPATAAAAEAAAPAPAPAAAAATASAAAAAAPAAAAAAVGRARNSRVSTVPPPGRSPPPGTPRKQFIYIYNIINNNI